MSSEKDFAMFDKNFAARLKVAKAKTTALLDAGTADAEKNLGIPHQTTSEHGDKVYRSVAPKAKDLARALIEEGAETATEYLVDTPELPKGSTTIKNPDKFIKNTLNAPQYVKKLSDLPGDFSQREEIRRQNGDVNQHATTRSK